MPTPDPEPESDTFGLDEGDSKYSQKAGILDAMRFENTAGDGTLTKLELLVSDTTPVGKVRMGVYTDNNGRPGSLLLDAGEVSIANGWVAISGLNLPVVSGDYYWLAFDMQSGNTVMYQHNLATDSHYWVSYGYGALPGVYPASGLSTNPSPYVMRATVELD